MSLALRGRSRAAQGAVRGRSGTFRTVRAAATLDDGPMSTSHFSSTSSSPSSHTPALDRFFGSLRRSSVTRSQDRMIAGVCAGIAERLGVSTAIVRVGAVVLAFLGPGVLLYLLAWLLLPAPDGRIRFERAVRGGEGSSIVLLVVTLLAIPGLFGRWHAWPVLVVTLGVLAVAGYKKGWFGGDRRSSACAPSAPPAPDAPQGPQDAPRA